MELLICMVDKHPVVATMFPKGVRRGHVIAAMPNNWKWSSSERNNPEWLIVKSDLLPIEVDALLAPDTVNGAWRNIVINMDGFSGDTLNRNDLMARIA